jgi:uncharacterized membrane protein YkoI
MRKNVVSIICVLLCNLSLFAISGREAEDAALKQAGVSRQNARITETKMDRDDSWTVYEITFWSGNTEYETKVDAQSAEIVEYSFKTHRSHGGQTQPVANGAPTREDAVRIALADASVREDQATRISCKGDWEDGRKVWEVEFSVGWKEYDYTIDSSTGQIFKKEIDGESSATVRSTNTSVDTTSSATKR